MSGSIFRDHLLSGILASRPAATAVPFGTLYACTDGNIYQSNTVTWSTWFSSALGGKIAQVVNVQTGAVNFGSTLIPYDDTIPQNTEGDEYMTLAITPTNASSNLLIHVVAQLACNLTSAIITTALFQDSTADALAATEESNAIGTNGVVATFNHFMTAGTTSSTTFKVRAGGNAGNITFNGQSGSRRYGGVAASSITITEILP